MSIGVDSTAGVRVGRVPGDYDDGLITRVRDTVLRLATSVSGPGTVVFVSHR